MKSFIVYVTNQTLFESEVRKYEIQEVFKMKDLRWEKFNDLDEGGKPKMNDVGWLKILGLNFRISDDPK